MTSGHPTAPETDRPLRPVGGRPPLLDYLEQTWRRRHFIYADSKARAFSGHRDMLLGNVWLIGVPALQALVFFIIFGLILKTSRGIENFPGFLVIGIFLFQFTMTCLNQGVQCLQQARGLTTAFSFPRMAIPLSVITRETLSMIPVLTTLAILLLILPPGTEITWTWLLFPLVFVLQIIFNFGLTLYVARLGATVPDVRHAVSFLARFWFYTSGVFFAVERFVSEGFWLAVMQNNPMFIVLDMSRDLLLYDTLPEGRSWVMLTVWALITATLGLWYFWQGEETYGQE
ncbi:ABC transporter permease [Ornithinimicrobium sp. Y1847]|uniref:ABC transporter permease n=1 Tax=Ornithinimicrobium sp. Y1847 TaxID=3405419 RepID=UPI003B67AFA6